jgi:hypothetical protein
LEHIVTLRFGGADDSGIKHILNGTGKAVVKGNMWAKSAN